MSDEMEWRSTTTVAKQPPTPPLLLAGYRLGVALWLLIGEEDEPQFSNTYEYLIRSPRYHLPARPSDEVGDEAPVRRKLEGEASVWTNYILMQGENGQRMDCPSLKTARGEVKLCEKVLDAALIELQKECNLQKSFLDSNDLLSLAVAKARRSLSFTWKLFV
ncbi:hypothetical protein Tco_0471265 [Tanacetum coccineum]